ncbi:MAG: hypothetical protein JRK53_26810 [Deltaproteobacteria bacterium]|nr:hypothetical protein [Deltaproteobacteria bacterium]MBW1819174.1 hypothetical protein [Deltaproteobacteria bacterium]
MNKKLVLMTVLIFGLGIVLMSCAGMQKPTSENFKNPVIALEEFMVPQYDGYWYYAKGVKPTKGKPGDRGAPLPMTFLFSIQNPNSYPVMLDGFQFTVSFDREFDVVTVNNQDTYWIPAGKTDYVRATTMITARSALLSLLVTGGYKLKAKGWNPWQALERWWTGVPDMSVPVMVHEGAFTFAADGVVKVLPFKAELP